MDPLLTRLRAELKRAAIPGKAAGMQAYMKSEMPYHGVPVPLVRRTCREIFRSVDLSTRAKWRARTLGLWNGARFREERYGAIALTGHPKAAVYQTPAALPLYRELIVGGAWWDYVDDIASHRIGPILRDHPAPMRPKLLDWSRSPNLWIRRTAILAQLGFKQETDLDLLYACIEPSLDSREFFLRKAIGWALRQYAWTDPAEVARYVRAHESRLSPLSRREALKNIP
jgi:3-methyladenine DNA glycosylase AlkD